MQCWTNSLFYSGDKRLHQVRTYHILYSSAHKFYFANGKTDKDTKNPEKDVACLLACPFPILQGKLLHRRVSFRKVSVDRGAAQK